MEYMGLKFDDTTGLLLNLNKTSEEIRDTLKECLSNNKKDNQIKQIEKENTKAIIKSNDKNNKLLVKNLEEYNKKIAQNLKEVSKKKKLKVDINGKLRDEKGRFVKQEKTASEKAKEAQDKKNDKSEKIEVKVPVEEIGEAVGDAYYQSYQELKTFFTPFVESTKSVFQFFSKRFFKDDKKDIKNASEKATKDNIKKDNTTKKLLENSKKELSTDEKILKELKHHRPKNKLNLGGILGILRKILLGLAPLGLMWGYIKNKLKLPTPNTNKQTTNNKNKPTKKPNNNNNHNKNKPTKKPTKGVYTGGEKQEREVRKRQPPKTRKRIQIPKKAGKKIGLKVGAKIGAKALPLLGWGLTAFDTFNVFHDLAQYKNATLLDSFNHNVLGMEADYKNIHLTKKELLMIKETKNAIANSKSVLKPKTGNKYNYTPAFKKTTWRDNSPGVKKQEVVKKEIQTKDTTNNFDLSIFKNQINISNKILQEQKKTNDLLNTLLSKTSGKTITYNPAKHSLRSEW